MSSIGAICGVFIFGFISSQIGSKRAMTFLAFPAITYWVLVRFGNTFYYLLLARFITGWTVGKTKGFVGNFRCFGYWYLKFCRWDAIWRCPLCFGNCKRQVNAITRYHNIYWSHWNIRDYSVRGRYGSITPLARNIGVLIGYVVGAVVEYEYRSYIFIVFPIVYLISVYYLPNTPQYYLHRENTEVIAFFFQISFKWNCNFRF